MGKLRQYHLQSKDIIMRSLLLTLLTLTLAKFNNKNAKYKFIDGILNIRFAEVTGPMVELRNEKTLLEIIEEYGAERLTQKTAVLVYNTRRTDWPEIADVWKQVREEVMATNPEIEFVVADTNDKHTMKTIKDAYNVQVDLENPDFEPIYFYNEVEPPRVDFLKAQDAAPGRRTPAIATTSRESCAKCPSGRRCFASSRNRSTPASSPPRWPP